MRETRTDLLHPLFRERVARTFERCEQSGIPIRVYESVRTPWRQAALYAKGRTIANTRRVTKAKAWESRHQFALAVDGVFFVDGKWTWEEPGPGMWLAYQQHGHSFGLDALSFEKPHLQLPWPEGDISRGILPPGDPGPWSEWLAEQAEKWGPGQRMVDGIYHHGAPESLLDLGDRPALVEDDVVTDPLMPRPV